MPLKCKKCGGTHTSGFDCRSEVIKSAQNLVDKLEEIHNDEHYRSVWTMYAIHGGDYSNGPKYDKELASLKKALAK